MPIEPVDPALAQYLASVAAEVPPLADGSPVSRIGPGVRSVAIWAIWTPVPSEPTVWPVRVLASRRVPNSACAARSGR